MMIKHELDREHQLKKKLRSELKGLRESINQLS